MKFSIVTPSFNQGHFISQTIESVLAQKGDFKIEYFIMDGGSTDNTVEIIKNFETRIKNNEYKKFNHGISLYWQSKKDKGQSDGINQGLKKATGDILAYINSDDTYEPGAFEKITKSFKREPGRTWLTGYCNIIDQDNKPIRSIITRYKNFWLRRYSYNKLLVLNFISQPATFWAKQTSDKYGFFQEKLHYVMDYEYWLRIGEKHQDPIILPEPISNFRIHGQSKGETSFKKQFAEDFQVAKKYSTSAILTALHKIHNSFILTVYKIQR